MATELGYADASQLLWDCSLLEVKFSERCDSV